MRLPSLHADHFDNEKEIHENSVDNNSSKAIVNTVDKLLKDYSDLIVDVEAGRKDKSELTSKIDEVVNSLKLQADNRMILIQGVHDYLFNYGKLQPLIEDEDISDIDFTQYNHGVIKRNGKKEKLENKFLFASELEFNRFAKTLIIRNNGIINENFSHERVADERYRLRINVAIPPRNLRYTSMNIRKHRQNPYTLNDLQMLGMLTEEQKHFLIKCVLEGNKFLLAGKGASGKTTLLRAMMKHADELNTYLVTEKDTELYFEERNFIQQRIKKENHGGLTITLGDLIKDGLTMSLDGYIVGEIVGEEAWHFINAGVTDHTVAGTIHASSAADVPQRLLSMIETFNPGPKAETIMGLIARSVDYIVHMKGFKINEIAKVGSFDYENKLVEIQALENGVF
jgi:pilus assembly protein CpaF